jgi:hypothetical protein
MLFHFIYKILHYQLINRGTFTLFNPQYTSLILKLTFPIFFPTLLNYLKKILQSDAL